MVEVYLCVCVCRSREGLEQWRAEARLDHLKPPAVESPAATDSAPYATDRSTLLPAEVQSSLTSHIRHFQLTEQNPALYTVYPEILAVKKFGDFTQNQALKNISGILIWRKIQRATQAHYRYIKCWRIFFADSNIDRQIIKYAGYTVYITLLLSIRTYSLCSVTGPQGPDVSVLCFVFPAQTGGDLGPTSPLRYGTDHHRQS